MEIIFTGLTGSRLYGCATADSDTDIINVGIEPIADMILGGSSKTKHKIDDEDVVTYSLSKFCSTLKKGSPSTSPILWHPSANTTEAWKEFSECREALRSTKLLKTFFMAGASTVQRIKTKYTNKEAATSFRWFNEVIFFAKEGRFEYPLDEEILDEYVAIKDGVLNLDEVMEMLAETERLAELSIQRSQYPDTINEQTIDEACIRAYKQTWGIA